MTSGSLEQRIASIDVQMQDMRDLLQQLVRSQVETQQQLDQTLAIVGEASVATREASVVAREASVVAREASVVAREASVVAREASAIAKSNARSIQAWEALIEQNKVEAEEELSRQAVRLADLQEANRENVLQHMEFRQRFDETLAEIRQLWGRLGD